MGVGADGVRGRLRFPANGAAPRGWSLKATAVVGRAGWVGRGIHAADTPANPPRPTSDGFRGRSATWKKEEEQKQNRLAGRFFVEPSPRSAALRSDFQYSIPMQIHPRMAWIYRVDQGRHLPTAAGTCRRRGTVGLRGVSRMDAATKPPWMGLRRPRKPAVPRHPTGSPLLLGLLLGLLPLQVPGATRPAPLPQGQAGGAATHACCTSANDARSSSRHCGNSCA